MKRVDRSRWLEAQQWELDLWRAEAIATRGARLRGMLAILGLGRIFGRWLGAGDDWNEWWKARFGGYSFVPNRVQRAIELGCGPFTNIRLMLRGRSFGEIVCSDPLASDYLRLRGTWLAEAAHRGVITIDSHPAEDCPFRSATFDLTVMINVLDHVQDMHLCLENAVRITAPDGIFVLGQDLTNDEDKERIGDDVGHPIRMTHDELDEVILPAFDVIQRVVMPRDKGRNPAAHYGTYLFAGRRKRG